MTATAEQLTPLEDGAMPDTTPPTQPAAGNGGTPPPPEGGQQGQQQPATGATPPAPPAGQQGQQQPPAQGGDETLGPAGLRALQAEREARAAAERERDALRAESTQLQQERAARQQAEQILATERAERLRLQVAQHHGLPADAMVLLTGTTEEQLTAQAAQIVALRGAQQPATPAPPAFAPNPGQAAGNGAPPGPASTVDAGRELYRRHKTTRTTL